MAQGKKGTKGENSGENGNNNAITEAIQSVGEEHNTAWSALHSLFEKGEFEARLKFSDQMQKANLDQRSADGAAYWQLMDALRALPPGEGAAAYEKMQEYERAAAERHRETETVLADISKELEGSLQELREASLAHAREIHAEHVGRIKEIWAKLDPADVDTNELQALAHLVGAAAHASSQCSDAR